ncbi:DUF1566 domain-containing protein [Candidatus Halobeggiatoa sp. HSG11]|nr:DUF1566 domain-containing protein [Candidatus Halobeggiatoa sp. HSG11]
MKKMKRYAQMALVPILLGSPLPLLAGSLNSPAAPDNTGSAMYTIEDIWDRLDGISASAPTAGFTEPTNGPGDTGKTLTEVYNKADTVMNGIPSCIPDTSANPVFTDNDDGTVTDHRTCLIWLKNANCAEATRNWATAGTDVTGLNNSGQINSKDCGDISNNGSHQTDWRLPNVKELYSLLDISRSNPALPNGHQFTGVQSHIYWSSTTYADLAVAAWYVVLVDGIVGYDDKAIPFYVWPVRGGQ